MNAASTSLEAILFRPASHFLPARPVLQRFASSNTCPRCYATLSPRFPTPQSPPPLGNTLVSTFDSWTSRRYSTHVDATTTAPPVHTPAMVSRLREDSRAPSSKTPPPNVVETTRNRGISGDGVMGVAEGKQKEPTKPAGHRGLKSQKAVLTLAPTAVTHLQALLDSPDGPKQIRISVKNKGCAGMSYHLQYVTQPGKFDEVVEQDGVKVYVDSKALFSIIGSEMDWQEDKLSAKFVFKNPNIKEQCGCGESFLV